MTKTKDTNRFEDFFAENAYQLLKNDLYNYVIRKEAVENELKNESLDRVLEVGSGISPMATNVERIVYTDLSLSALYALKQEHGNGFYVVADGTRLPFKQRMFSHVICSEVLEHIKDDGAAICELSRVLEWSGKLVVTFPHNKFYFSIDDRLVHHYRRYDLGEMIRKMSACGLLPLRIKKVLGPLEKITMIVVAVIYLLLHRIANDLSGKAKLKHTRGRKLLKIITPLYKWANRLYAVVVRLDAAITPRVLATVLLMKCMHKERNAIDEQRFVPK